jgi:hypothetical protein
MGFNEYAVKRMAQSGVLKASVVISNPMFANWLRDYVDTVVHRYVWSDHDPLPDLTGNEAHDRAVARAWYNGPLHSSTIQCRKDVYIQLVNEQSYPYDGFFYDELMACAESEGYHLCIENDSGGAPGNRANMTALWFDVNDMPHSDFFVQHRQLPCRRAVHNGHLYGWHSYGDITTGKYNRSDNPGVYQWFSGRQFYWLSLLDPADVPNILITEFGSGATQFTKDKGFDECWSNYAGFEALAWQEHPALMAKVKGICQWSWGNAPGFPGQYVDDWTDKFIDQLHRA